MWKYPFLTITTCLVAGILLGNYLLSFYHSFLICFLSTLIWVGLTYLRKSHMCVQILIMISVISAASLRLHLSQNYLPQNHIIFANPDEVETVEGNVLEVHHLRENRYRYIVSVSQICKNSRNLTVSGKILVNTYKISQQAEYGNEVRLYGKVDRLPAVKNPGQFDYPLYMSRQDIYYQMKINADSNFVITSTKIRHSLKSIFIEPLRDYCYQTFSRYLKGPAENLACALFLGEKQGLDKDTVTRFKKTGVVHILAISGLHVGFIIAFVMAVSSLLRLPPSFRLFVLISVLFIYVFLINFRPPVIRASLMAVLLISAKSMQRTVNIHNIILAAAAVILLHNPQELFNPGFQFSFVAVLSITNGYQGFNRLFPLIERFKAHERHKNIFRFLGNWIWIPFLVSCSATLGTLPLTWFYYGFIPLYAAVANLVVIPLTGLLVLLIIFLLLTAPISAYITGGIAGIFTVIHDILMDIVALFSNLPLVSVECPIPPPTIAVGFLILAFLFFHIHQKVLRPVILPLLFILFLYMLIPDPMSYALRVAFLDVGQGDAAVLEFPNKRTMLIDAGDRNRHWDNGDRTIIPYLQSEDIRHLNYVVLTHPHNDHLGGMKSVISRVKVDTVVTTNYTYHSKAYLSFLKFCDIKHIPVRCVKKGDRLYPDSLCRVYVLHPDSFFVHRTGQDGSTCNNSSIVLKIIYGNNSLMLMGDAEIEAEKSVNSYAELLRSDILKIGHHGSITSTSVQFLNRIHPIIAIISVGENNRFNHPSPIILDRLNSTTPKVYQTKQDRAIVFEITPEIIKKIAW